jgi:hypothetical protein
VTYKRMAAAIAAGFLVSEVLAIVVHGIVLAPDYARFYGTLLRSQQQGSWQMIFLPVAHLSFVSVLAWLAGRLRLHGRLGTQGLKLGLLGWLIGQIPLWLLWYAEQPWPGDLVLKQHALELVSSLVIGLTICFVGRPPESRVKNSFQRGSPATSAVAG